MGRRLRDPERAILALLQQRPFATRKELAEETKQTQAWVSELLWLLHRQGAAHVARWVSSRADKRGGKYLPAFAAGPGKDAPKPVGSTAAQRARAWRKRNPERYKEMLHNTAARKRKADASKRVATIRAREAIQALRGDPLLMAWGKPLK